MSEILRRVTMFEALDERDLDTLHSVARQITAERGEIIVSQGSEGESLYVVVSGQIRVYLSDEAGKEIILGLEGPGAIFGEIAVLDGQPRSASVAAMKRTELLRIDGAQLRELLRTNARLSFSVIAALAGMIRKLTDATQGLALQSAYRRLVARLQERAVEENGQSVIPERLTHQLLADMIGCSREMVSRIMSDLGKGGYIRAEGKRWIIERKLPADY
ncbi:MAG: Crp/Fnr family transcriptional regulator [Acidiferrobacteraceae bacterium]|jgi:CRP/FNR family cyclic AMP-dependent transcriptional regulator|nr:Crp/Fnr family transcriptional regulator [Acidiferrobacteraceae bacterium]MDP6397660.1 Crp/Fnr family transcriptional regulator [Arenicellales bacterium]MDP6551451.1 Crp/Fnr family transcriptional regulator [Arenicellales bacterium]MDP6790478.1 Crp/Fnr family transcriptional regulator [Arenicellales bacterium]MDP6917717.1 Crp/Fnr family transcriptional regulator [Arenicellales bacterium]